MNGIAARPLASLLEQVAAATPAPGGGSSAAWTCALGAALGEMAARIAGDRDAEAERLRALRAEALELAERELSSYEPVLEALRLPRDDPGRQARLDEALAHASLAPLAVAEAAGEVAELGAALAAGAKPAVRGDALAGVLLAEAAAATATALVAINIKGHPGQEMLVRAREASVRAAAARAAVLGDSG
jgi:formiminotetrahydrofolate cyclodeaminase